jgi:hypothetical protein
MRLAEKSNQELIKMIDADAVAREVFRRLELERFRVSDRVQVLEHQVQALQGVAL